MPQLEQTEFFISQLFWLVLTFSFLLIFLWRISLPRISSVLEKRENKINNDIESAKQQQTEAEEIEKIIEKELITSRNEGSDLIKSSTNSIQETISNEIKEYENKLNKKIDDTSSDIENDKKEIINQIDNQIYEITKMLFSKLSLLNVEDQEIKDSILSIKNKTVN
tara:strand:+ start:179 stop:676 length:498 start_codon:yes stop_codon:yes gene_type:complete